MAAPSVAGSCTNHLAEETSPYLLQHARNPVEWYPWGEEALRRAKAEDKPLFLSIGYSACHWCHVMERESFEDEETAALLNEHFVSVKVDREERPDLDEIYMASVQILTGSGGWPLSVFLTPDRDPFFGGTYFPPDDAYGRPAFKTVLRSISEAWDQRREDVLRSAAQLTQYVRATIAQMAVEGSKEAAGAKLGAQLLDGATRELTSGFDSANGGFGPAPKFPSSPAIELLLRRCAETNERNLLDMAVYTLRKMAQGGLCDHLGGGFHRYSVDEQWLVPHFEKMLYDNAQLAEVYLDAFQATSDPFFRRVAKETLDYLLRDMQDADGGFYSSEDADSDGEEGSFYLWSEHEVMTTLGPDDGHLFCRYYNVRPRGNFSSHQPYHEGKNILHVAEPLESLAKDTGIPAGQLEARLGVTRAKLLEVRGRRVRPGRDDKILTSWNALAIAAFARAYQVLVEEKYRIAAQRAADFILTNMTPGGELLHSHRRGESRVPGYLNDYAFLVVALVDLYEATFELRWLNEADHLAEVMTRKFWDGSNGGFFFTSADHVNLIARTKSSFDGAEPSGNSMAALGLLRLGRLTDNADHVAKARQVLETNCGNLHTTPRGFLKMMCALDTYLHPASEVVIVGAFESEPVHHLLGALHSRYIPNKVVAFADPAGADAPEIATRIPLTAPASAPTARKELVSGEAAAYVCRNGVCYDPVTTPEALLALLGTE